MTKQKENSHDGITWSEMGKQNVQAEKIYITRKANYKQKNEPILNEMPSKLRKKTNLPLMQ